MWVEGWASVDREKKKSPIIWRGVGVARLILRFLLIDPPAHALTPSCVHAQPLATGTIIHTQRRDLIMEEDGSKPVAAAAAQEEAEKQG